MTAAKPRRKRTPPTPGEIVAFLQGREAMGDVTAYWLLTYSHWDPDDWHGFGGEWRVQALTFPTRERAQKRAKDIEDLHPTIVGPLYQRMPA